MIKRRTQEDHPIDDLLVTTTQYPLREALQLQAVLAKRVLPVLAKLDGATLVAVVRGDAGGRLGAALVEVAEQLDPAELWPLVCRVLASTQVVTERGAGKRIELTSGAAIESCVAELATLYKLLTHVLAFNFKRSFSAASSVLPATTPSEQPAAQRAESA